MNAGRVNHFIQNIFRFLVTSGCIVILQSSQNRRDPKSTSLV